jgi:hypothetical protein
LVEVINDFEAYGGQDLIKDKDQFIRDTKISRNYYTHLDPELEKKALKRGELFRLTEMLKLVLYILILIETGFSKSSIEKALKSNGVSRFFHIR